MEPAPTIDISKPPPKQAASGIRLVEGIILVIGLLGAAWAMTREWNKPLLDFHSFRQTQTAISAYYMARDAGAFLDYPTPVLGKPWTIPMEMPFYQWIVARWHNFSGMGLDQSGKTISIAMWFACVWPLWRLLGSFALTLAGRTLSLVLLYSSPLYLYWGRSFMIESTGLFLSLAMVACVWDGYRKRSALWLTLGCAFGCAAALCKVTTWAVSAGVAGLLILFAEGVPRRRDFLRIAISGALLLLPVVPAKCWLAYGDHWKQQNLFARDLIVSSSPHQRTWNFGSLAQRMDSATWKQMAQHVSSQLLVPTPLLSGILIGVALWAMLRSRPGRNRIVAIFVSGFLAGPLVFTNLYLQHNYYWFANSLWLLLALGVALDGLGERLRVSWRFIALPTMALILGGCGFWAWKTRFLPVLRRLPSQEQLAKEWTKPVEQWVPEGKTLLILGHDWDPTALYYARRKGVMVPASRQSPLADLQKSVALLEPGESPGAVLFGAAVLTQENQAEYARVLQAWGMSLQGNPTPFGALFPALPLRQPSEQARQRRTP